MPDVFQQTVDTVQPGLMQPWPLTLDRIIDHAARWHGHREVVGRSTDGTTVRSDYAHIRANAKRLSHALLQLGISAGDRVGTLAWNSIPHMESWYAITGIGAIYHTLNPRLFDDQLFYIINHAGDKLIFTDDQFLDRLLNNIDKIPSVETIVIMSSGRIISRPDMPLYLYEELLADQPAEGQWGGFTEETAAGLCYTSGTTGHPKGVLYSHRSNFLHTLVSMSPDMLGLTARDVVLPLVPMFHANGWGLPFSAPAVGAKLILPGPKMDGASVHELIVTEGVTFSAAVPTVWQMLLMHLRETGGEVPSLQRIVVAGSALPDAILRGFEDEFGVRVRHAWGMTEISPLGSMSLPTIETSSLAPEEQHRLALRQGRPPLGIDMKLVDDEGRELPRDGEAAGHLLVQGPFTTGGYFGADAQDALDGQGFFDTGDIATIDRFGFMKISDRAKDVIKSGGEWISSIDIENIVTSHPAVALAAVIGIAHPKWDERPLLIVQYRAGHEADRRDVLRFLEGRIAKWWMPDDVVPIQAMPLGATGKIDKKRLRQIFAGHATGTPMAAENG